MRFFETPTPIMYEYQGFWGSFWDLIWWFFTIFIFVSYLFVLFAIIGDLFRDRKLNGGWKALWVILLLFFPLVTALAYLIIRGRGMGERSVAQAEQAREAQADYIRSVSGSAVSPSEEISRAKSLLDAGTITPAEYETLKTKALG